MSSKKQTVTQQRDYSVLDVQAAKQVALVWLQSLQLDKVISFGLPEVDDRYHVWRVPLLNVANHSLMGEAVIDARSSLVIKDKSTSAATLEARLLGRDDAAFVGGVEVIEERPRLRKSYSISSLRNIIASGDSENILQDFPAESVDLVFTSPPYYNARPEYTDFVTYEEYLLKMRKIIQNIHRVLGEGRFFVMNISPVLIRRTSRSQSSRRVAVPFDVHRIFVEEGYDFVDDIIWQKPEGAGWATGRGRRFAADRNPLQYKPVPVTEYVLVYRKHTDRLIDWNIRAHPDQKLVKESRIEDDYEKTNIWKIGPAHDKRHPAIFPMELAEKVVTYYSFKNDVVLDPFAGIGTVGKAAAKTDRRFVLIEREPRYVEIIREEAKSWLGKNARDVLTINCPSIDISDILF